MPRIYKRWYAVRYNVARDFMQQIVAYGASRKRVASRIERETRHHLANLIAEEMRLNIEGIGCGAQTLVAGEHPTSLRACPAQRIGRGQPIFAEHVGAHDAEPFREPHQGTIRGESRNISRFFHCDACSIAGPTG